MDIGFEILLPIDVEMSDLKFSEPLYNFGAEIYSQGPAEARFHYFRLIKYPPPRHIIEVLPEGFQKEIWQCISVVEGVDALICELSVGLTNVDNENTLIKLLNLLIGKKKKWVIAFEPDYDGVDIVMKGNFDIAYSKIIDSLTVENKGFVIWCE